MASIKQHQRRSLGWHDAAVLALGLMLVAGSSFGQGFREYSPYAGIATSSTACGIGIGMSSNRPQAAAIGLPILIAGNIVSLRLHAHHPKLAAILQQASGLGCLAGGLTRSEHRSTNSPNSNSFANSPSGAGTNGSSNVPPGGVSGVNSGNGNGSSSTGTNAGSNSGSVGNGGNTAGGGNGGGSTTGGSGSSAGTGGGSTVGNGGNTGGGSSGGGVGGGSTGGCITGGNHDCGLGNGGTNTGAGQGIGTTPPGQNGGTHAPGAGGLPPGQLR